MEEKIKSKLEEISRAKEQVTAQLNAIIGAEQVLKEILSNQKEE